MKEFIGLIVFWLGIVCKAKGEKKKKKKEKKSTASRAEIQTLMTSHKGERPEQIEHDECQERTVVVLRLESSRRDTRGEEGEVERHKTQMEEEIEVRGRDLKEEAEEVGLKVKLEMIASNPQGRHRTELVVQD